MLRFVAAGLFAAAVISVGAYWVVSQNAVAEAIRNAQEIAAIDGRNIAGPALTAPVVNADAAAMSAFDRLVRERVLSSRVVRIKIWTPEGRIVYSDAAALVGKAYPLGADEQAAIRDNRVVAEVSELGKPENIYERGYGRLLEVYLPIRAVSGGTFLFESYQVYSSIDDDQRRIWGSFFPVLVGGIAMLFVVQVPLAWRLASKLEASRREREALLTRALDASEVERRRIARDLHDGVVQALAGVAFSLGAVAGTEGAQADPAVARALADGAAANRQAVRDLRSLIVEIAPPDLRGDRLENALADLLAPFEAEGVGTRLECAGLEDLGGESAALLHRAAHEALRNVLAHAGAKHVAIEVDVASGGTVLRVSDDGQGFTVDDVLARQREGHVGLALLRGLVEDGGGELRVSSRPGEGTTIEVRLGAP